MCGRYAFFTDEEYEDIKNIINEVSEKYEHARIANGEVYPTNNVPIIYAHGNRNILSFAKWGFPSFKNSGVIINARAETITEKPMFRKSFAAKRCLIPANGYFEWLTENKRKTKYLIGIDEKKLFFMAGIYNEFSDKDGNPYLAVTIVTTEANSDVVFIHNRMPVILTGNNANTWIDGSIIDLSILEDIMVPYGVEKMKYVEYK